MGLSFAQPQHLTANPVHGQRALEIISGDFTVYFVIGFIYCKSRISFNHFYGAGALGNVDVIVNEHGSFN